VKLEILCREFRDFASNQDDTNDCKYCQSYPTIQEPRAFSTCTHCGTIEVEGEMTKHPYMCPIQAERNRKSMLKELGVTSDDEFPPPGFIKVIRRTPGGYNCLLPKDFPRWLMFEDRPEYFQCDKVVPIGSYWKLGKRSVNSTAAGYCVMYDIEGLTRNGAIQVTICVCYDAEEEETKGF
jgi:hypothetical protein